MPTSPPLNGVLLVDDDATTNFLNKLLLGTTMRVAKEILVAENGAEALRLLRGRCTPPDGPGCPELILLDMNMPAMNGLAFPEVYFALPPAQRQHTVVAMLTTSLNPLNPLNQACVQQLPITGFLNKPLTREKVTALLQEHCLVVFASELHIRNPCRLAMAQRGEISPAIDASLPKLRNSPVLLAVLASVR